MKLKVCGMREAHNINALVRLEPDYMGFIFWEPSKRYCAEVPNGIPDGIQKALHIQEAREGGICGADSAGAWQVVERDAQTQRGAT